MASLATISKRAKTIRTTQKITNAMKLVSMSKLQRYKALLQAFEGMQEALLAYPHESYETAKPILTLAFLPDLGLASHYTRSLCAYLEQIKGPLLIVGTKGRDALLQAGAELINEPLKSDQMDINTLETFEHYQTAYQMDVIIPVLKKDLQFEVVKTNRRLVKQFSQVEEPSFDAANQSFQTMLLKHAVISGYYQSKVVEYTMRRMAMEKACDSADDMLYDLNLQYNRLRQERITAEIADIVSKED